VNVPLPPREIRIRSHALDRLLLYARRCPVEIGGLGTVAADADGLLITDVFLLAQRVSASDTELDTEALFDFLARHVAEGGDPAQVRLWWHSHADMDVVWSETDRATIRSLPGDFWVALLVNRRGEVVCRLDAFLPRRHTWELPLVEVLDPAGRDPETLCRAIDREILEKVRAYTVVHAVMGNEGMADVPTESPIPLVLESPPPRLQPADAGEGK
jgi:proteasome lid subunit RPN8/RPN11